MYTTMSKPNITPYVNNLFTFFLAGLLRLISLHYWLSFTDSFVWIALVM